jgi:DNA-directed RNA polymerase subunit RPC12/RpoP
MATKITKKIMYEENTIAAKYVKYKREYPSCGGLENVQDYVTKKIERIRYLKVCWNCGQAYESLKHNSFACKAKCRYNIIYKLKNGIKPPVRMELHMKAKNISRLKEMYDYF